MRLIYCLFLLVLLPAPTLAQQTILPELYSVHGIESNDKLNIRAQPNANSPIIDALAYDARDVEVISISGNWAKMNAGEGSGWVSMRYLQPQPSVWKNNQLPASLSCFGTEPFWRVKFDQNTAKLSMPDTSDQSFLIEHVSDRGYPEDRMRAVQAGNMSAVISPASCSDGMSERSYALEAVILLRGGDRPMLSGCCTIAH